VGEPPQAEEQELDALRNALLFGLRASLPAQDPGYAAFERHMLLAIRFHRAARLNAPWETERQGWLLYFKEHFPRGDEHALRLWDDWRGRLVKDEFPGTLVAVSHGQSRAHWILVEPGQRLFINLESMWDDFERSVESFMQLLASDEERRGKTLEKFRRRRWTVQQVFSTKPPAVTTTTASLGFTEIVASSSAWAPPPGRIKPKNDADSAR
jgi:hypothetical protein